MQYNGLHSVGWPHCERQSKKIKEGGEGAEGEAKGSRRRRRRRRREKSRRRVRINRRHSTPVYDEILPQLQEEKRECKRNDRRSTDGVSRG